MHKQNHTVPLSEHVVNSITKGTVIETNYTSDPEAKIEKPINQLGTDMAAWENHRKEAGVVDVKGNNKTRESMGKEYKARRDVIKDIDGPYEDIPTSITVTGDEEWMKYFGLTEALPWPQEEVNTDDTSQMYGNTSWPE